jgi:hypothetical protein
VTAPEVSGAGAAGGRPDDPDAEAIAAAVRACPGVADLYGGLAGELATYLPGRRVTGLRVRPDFVEVHVVGRYGVRVADIAGQVRRAVSRVAPGLRVDVLIDDLDVPMPDQPPPEQPAPPPVPALPAAPTTAVPGGAPPVL